MLSISDIYALTNGVIKNTESTISTYYVDIKLEQYQNGEPYTKGNEGLTGNKNIVVTGYGIQTEGLTSTAPADVWGNF